jgi:hypothetical protein
MASVDLALHGLLRRHWPSAKVRFTRLYSPRQRNPDLPADVQERLRRRQELPVAYSDLRRAWRGTDEDAALVYWGDFLHSREYLHQMGAMLHQIGAARDLNRGLKAAYRYLLLTAAPRGLLARTVAFGGTLIFNRERDYRDPVYALALASFAAGARGIWMRDVYSALRISGLRNSGNWRLGVDGSLLLREEDLESLPATDWFSGAETGQPLAGLFLGRTSADPRPLVRFARDLCSQLRVEAEWLPWFDPRMLPNHLPQARSTMPALRARDRPVPPLLGDLLRRLRRYAFVISDTYHVCLNAWRSGVPALCIGEALPNPQGFDVSTGWFGAWRDKRQVFYAMHDAMEFYIFREELERANSYRNRLLHATELVRDRALAAAVTANILERRDIAEAELLASLETLLGPREGLPCG